MDVMTKKVELREKTTNHRLTQTNRERERERQRQRDEKICRLRITTMSCEA